MYKLVITCVPYGDIEGEFETIIKEEYFDTMHDLAVYIANIKRLDFTNTKLHIYKYINKKYYYIGDFTKYEQQNSR